LNKADLPADGDVRLREYGVVEGWLLVDGEPKSGVNMSLAPLAWSPSIRSHVSYTVTPGPDGRFSFTGVPPGQYKLYRWALPKRRDTSGQTITETYQHPVSVVAGQTTEVEYYTPGRRIIGQAVTSPANLAVNWSWDIHTLALKLPDVKSGGVNREDYVTFDGFQQANAASLAARGRLDQAGRVRTYPLQFEVDGTFQIDDVPPGLYELRIGVTKPGESSRRNSFGRQDEIGSLVREVTVSAGAEPLDLGLLTVPVEAAMIESGEVTKSSGPAASLEARTLSGRKFSLSQLAGRHVLLVFWASWSERSVSQWAELEKVINQAGPGSRPAMVGVSLDETLDAARQTAARQGWKGTQVWVDAEGRARLAGTFDVNTLPSIFLLDGEHRILARELEADRLPDIMKRMMAKK
jgi:hypothetical protein